MENKCIWQVYAYINKINHKKYIGVTKHALSIRANGGKGYISCHHFYHAIKKYGWENFDSEIIASNLSIDEALNFEKLLIKAFKTQDPSIGYNITSGGQGHSVPCSEETKLKISRSHKGLQAGSKNPMWGKERPEVAEITRNALGKEILQYNLKGNLIKEWKGVRFISDSLSIDRRSLMRAIKGEKKTYHKHIWRNKDNPLKEGEAQSLMKRRSKTKPAS